MLNLLLGKMKQMCDTVTWCHQVTELKVGLLMRCFRSSVFCGREELLLVQALTFLTFKIFYMHKNINH